MDTSEKYIEMCKKAKEIKRLWQFRENDYRDYIVCKEHRCLIEMSDHYYCPEKKGNVCLYPSNLIWLPRQDQLQEILNKPKRWADSAFDMLCSIYDFSQDWCGGGAETIGLNHFGEYLEKFSSAEQVWLAFVMREKYQKIWNGKDWIKEK